MQQAIDPLDNAMSTGFLQVMRVYDAEIITLLRIDSQQSIYSNFQILIRAVKSTRNVSSILIFNKLRGFLCFIYIIFMKGVKRVRVRKLQGTPYLLSEQIIANNAKGSIRTAYNADSPNQQLIAKLLNLKKDESIQLIKLFVAKLINIPQHQNLVKYHQIRSLNENSYCVIMEYCNEGDLANRIADMKLMPEQKIWIFLKQVSKGYQILFDNGIVHLKISPNNILISKGKYKITDVEYQSRSYSSLDSEEISKKELLYIAPQLQHQQISSKLDVFSLGCIAYQLAYDGVHPFQESINQSSCPSDYFQRVSHTAIMLKQKNKKGQRRSDSLRQLIHRMLQPAQKRISWEQIFEHPNIGINIHHKEPVTGTNEKENQIDLLRKILVNVNRSSIFIKEDDIPEDEKSQGSQERTVIAFERILDKEQLKYMEQTMLRLKIVFLSIIYCNHKINTVVRQNAKHKKLQGYMVQSIKKVAVQGLLYLLKNIEITINRINDYDEKVTKDLRAILNADKQRVIEQYKKETRVFKKVDEENFIQTLKGYDLRSFEHCLYSLLTVYCDYYKEGKEILRVVIAILIDIYDTALRLTEMTQKEKISWRTSDYEEIQTKMDLICLSPHHAHELHSYLASKQLVTQKELNSSLKMVGLLFE